MRGRRTSQVGKCISISKGSRSGNKHVMREWAWMLEAENLVEIRKKSEFVG